MKFKATLAGLLLAGFALSAGDASAQPHRAGPSYLYPDPATTPGVVNPDITQGNIGQTICNPQWSTKSIRPPVSYTNHLKAQQLAAARFKDKTGCRATPARAWVALVVRSNRSTATVATRRRSRRGQRSVSVPDQPACS